MEQNIWIQDGNTFVKGSATTKAHPEGLPKGIYEVKESMAGTYVRTDSISLNKEIKYLKIGDEFDDRPIFYINSKKGYIVTCYNHFIIYVIKSGYSTNASGKFNQIY